NGTVLDTTGFAISTASADQTVPSVAFGGANYLVAWMDQRNGNLDIYAARVSPGGTVLDPSGIPVTSNVRNQFNPAVVYDGTNYLVTWHDSATFSNTIDVAAARVGQGGNVIDPNGFLVSTVANDQLT